MVPWIRVQGPLLKVGIGGSGLRPLHNSSQLNGQRRGEPKGLPGWPDRGKKNPLPGKKRAGKRIRDISFRHRH